MIPPSRIFGRLGNSMFQYAFLYSYARKLNIDFYFQDLAFFEDHADEIRQLYSQGIPEMTNKIAVHVRRAGNPINLKEPKYCDNPFHFNLSETSYYEKGMSLFPDDEFLVFSDDPEWCLEKFKDNPSVKVMDKGDEIADMNLFASCKGIIGANSSWSWWGAFLAPYATKIVFPSKEHWFSDGVERTVCPQTWIRL